MSKRDVSRKPPVSKVKEKGALGNRQVNAQGSKLNKASTIEDNQTNKIAIKERSINDPKLKDNGSNENDSDARNGAMKSTPVENDNVSEINEETPSDIPQIDKKSSVEQSSEQPSHKDDEEANQKSAIAASVRRHSSPVEDDKVSENDTDKLVEVPRSDENAYEEPSNHEPTDAAIIEDDKISVIEAENAVEDQRTRENTNREQSTHEITQKETDVGNDAKESSLIEDNKTADVENSEEVPRSDDNANEQLSTHDPKDDAGISQNDTDSAIEARQPSPTEEDKISAIEGENAEEDQTTGEDSNKEQSTHEITDAEREERLPSTVDDILPANEGDSATVGHTSVNAVIEDAKSAPQEDLEPKSTNERDVAEPLDSSSRKDSPDREISPKKDSVLDPDHEPFTHPMRPQPKQVLGENSFHPNSVDNSPGVTRKNQSSTQPDENEAALDSESKFLITPTHDNNELPPKDYYDENKHKSLKSSGIEPKADFHVSKRPHRIRGFGENDPFTSSHPPAVPRQAAPLFTGRHQHAEEKLPPLNAQRQGLITKKYGNYYFSNERLHNNLPQINTAKLSDSMEAINSVQQNDRNRGLYLQTIRNAIRKLRYLRHYDSLEAHQAIYMLVFSANKNMSSEIGKILVEERSAEILVNMLKKLTTTSSIFMSDLTWAVTSGILVIMSDYSHKNFEFARELADAGAIPALLANVQHKPSLNTAATNKNTSDIIMLCIATLYSISCVPEADFHFDKNKVPKVLRTLYSSPSNIMQLLSTMIMSNILFDHDPTRFLEETGSIRYLVDALAEFAKDIKSKRKQSQQIDGESIATARSIGNEQVSLPDSSSSSRNIFSESPIPQQGLNLDALEILRTLSRVAIHDGHKYELLKLEALNMFSKYLNSHSHAEQAMAATAMWSLISGPNLGAAGAAINELAAMEDTVSLIRKMSERSSNSSVRYNCQALAWLIDNRDYKRSASSAPNPSGNLPGGQIYISYSSASSDLVAKVTKKLRAVGFMVQPDASSGPESLPLPAAVAAIESSNVILIFCSQRFKTEPRCRTEVEFAIQLQRPILFIRTEFHMTFTGWLSSSLGARDTLDLSTRRYSYDEGIKRLMRFLGIGYPSQPRRRDEIDVDRANVLQRRAMPLRRFPIKSNSENFTAKRNARVVQMSRDDVQKWFSASGMDNYSEKFSRYDGQMMDNLHELHQSAPEFVCQSLIAKMDSDFDNVIMFFTALNKLYDS